MGSFYRDVHADHGVEMHFGVAHRRPWWARLQWKASAWPTGAWCPRTSSRRYRGGAEDRTGRASGYRDRQNGVLTDEYLETSRPGVFAAGDLANSFHPLFGERVRVEHWANAAQPGPAAARNMFGRHEPYTRVPYFYSDQYDVGMEYSGYAPDWDEVIFRGDV